MPQLTTRLSITHQLELQKCKTKTTQYIPTQKLQWRLSNRKKQTMWKFQFTLIYFMFCRTTLETNSSAMINITNYLWTRSQVMSWLPTVEAHLSYTTAFHCYQSPHSPIYIHTFIISK